MFDIFEETYTHLLQPYLTGQAIIFTLATQLKQIFETQPNLELFNWKLQNMIKWVIW